MTAASPTAHKRYTDKEKRRAYFRGWYRGRAEKGLCRACPKPAASGRRQCVDHLAAKRTDMMVRIHDIDQARYAAMLKAQGNVCAICLEPPPAGKRLAIDHDHATERRRGLLCSRCNTGLGQFRDRPELLAAAAAYLRRPM